MNIEKIKNYNQKMLAIFATIIVVLASAGLVILICVGVSEFNRNKRYQQQNTGVLSDQKIDELQQEQMREQIISFDKLSLIDTVNSIYIAPVSHINLINRENLSDKFMQLESKINYEYVDSRYSNNIYGVFNNLIIYDQPNNTTHKLFETRVNFNEINPIYFLDDIQLLMSVAEKDTYKDGVINLNDLKSLYTFSIGNRSLRKIELAGYDIVDYKFLNNSKDLIIRFGFDKNKDGMFDSNAEPILLKKYVTETSELVDFIDSEMVLGLQKTLEGTPN
jgi:hypothetical protein